MEKVCKSCDREYEDYGQRRPICRPCKQEYDREYHRKRSDEVKRRKKERQKLRRDGLAKQFAEWKTNKGCHFCDETHSCCLDLHHLDPEKKDINLGDALKNGWKFERLMEEAGKCIVVCANCHRKVHAGLLGV